MSVITMLGAADNLAKGARSLALLAGPEASSAAAATAREAAAGHILRGAEGVRALGGPFFDRLADTIVTQARDASSGRNVTMSISSALEGERWILGRIAHTAA